MKQGIRIGVAVAGAGFVAMIAWASVRGDFGAEFASISAMPWGKVSLVDLYLGFALFGLAVFAVEPKRWVAFLWVVPVFVVGNAWACAWVAARWPVIMARLAPPPAVNAPATSSSPDGSSSAQSG